MAGPGFARGGSSFSSHNIKSLSVVTIGLRSVAGITAFRGSTSSLASAGLPTSMKTKVRDSLADGIQSLDLNPLSLDNANGEMEALRGSRTVLGRCYAQNHTVRAPQSMFRLAHPALADGMFSFSSRNVKGLRIIISLCDSDSDGDKNASSDSQLFTDALSGSGEAQPRARTPYPFGVARLSASSASSWSDFSAADSDNGSRPFVRTPFPFDIADLSALSASSSSESDVAENDSSRRHFVRSPYPFGVAGLDSGWDAESSVIGEDEWDESSGTPSSGSDFGERLYCDGAYEDEEASEAPSSGSNFSECLYCLGAHEEMGGLLQMGASSVSVSTATASTRTTRPNPLTARASTVEMSTASRTPSSHRAYPGRQSCARCNVGAHSGPEDARSDERAQRVTAAAGAGGSRALQRNSRPSTGLCRFNDEQRLAREAEEEYGVVSPKAGGFERPLYTEELGAWTGQHVRIQDMIGEVC